MNNNKYSLNYFYIYNYFDNNYRAVNSQSQSVEIKHQVEKTVSTT